LGWLKRREELAKITVLNASGGQRGLASLKSKVFQGDALGCPAGAAVAGAYCKRLKKQ
jgi:hypothetical protein